MTFRIGPTLPAITCGLSFEAAPTEIMYRPGVTAPSAVTVNVKLTLPPAGRLTSSPTVDGS